jgi:hypothetical protein
MVGQGKYETGRDVPNGTRIERIAADLATCSLAQPGRSLEIIRHL